MDSSWHSDSTLVESAGIIAECCPCRPFARQSPPKTFRSAGTSTEPIGLVTGISSMSVAKNCTASPLTSRRTDCDSPSSSRSSALPASISRPTEIASACRATDRKVQDIYCGISRLCRRPMTPSMLPAPVAASADSAGLDRSRSLTFNSTFNPCYTSTTPPDNDDEDECDDDFDIDELLSSTFGKRYGRQGGYEMSQSCLEGRTAADSSSASPSAASAAVASAAAGFRPASWAGPPSNIIACNAGFSSPPSCLIDRHNECQNGMVELSKATVCVPPHASRLIAGNSSRSASDSKPPVVEDVHYYWELESTRSSAGPTLHLHNPNLMLEFNQRPIVPIQMGTQLRLAETHQAGAASLSQVSSPLLTLPTESSAKSKQLKVPQMGRCAVMKPTGSDCCTDATVRSAVLVPVPKCDPTVRKMQRSTAGGGGDEVEELQLKEVKQTKPHRCPTPPRILSPADDGEACEVAIADI